MIIAKEQEELELDEQTFEKLFEFINNENLSNPYRVKTKDGRWIDLYIEDSYDYIQEAEHKKGYLNKKRSDKLMNENLLIRYRRALEGLTVGGSEYYNNPERCAEDIRHRLNSQSEMIKRLVKEKNELRNEFRKMFELIKENDYETNTKL